MGRATIDIDSNNISRLLKTIWKAVRMGVKIEKIAISPSGKGFHVVVSSPNIKTDMDNIVVRALLDDDPYRIRYSLKRMAFGGKVDILFEAKEGGCEREIDLGINFNELEKMNLEEVMELAEKMKEKIPVGSYYALIFEIPDEKFDDIKETLEDIAARDPSFKFSIRRNLYKKGKTEYIGVVICPDKDTAHKRGVWLIHNVGIKGYWIKQIGKSD